MTEIILFAIRHNPSGGFIPLPLGTNGRGGSFVEPVDFTKPTKRLVRMFSSEHGAKVALTMWLMGKHSCYRSAYGDEQEITIKPQPHRKREEMQVVPVTITLPEPMKDLFE